MNSPILSSFFRINLNVSLGNLFKLYFEYNLKGILLGLAI